MKKLILILFTILILQSGLKAQVAVIVNKSVPLDTIKKTELLDFFTGDIKKWPDGKPVVVKELKVKGRIREAFYDYLGKNPSRMKSIWLKKMLSGEGDPPESIVDSELMVKKIEMTPGAIGFVAKEKISPGVKVLLFIPKK